MLLLMLLLVLLLMLLNGVHEFINDAVLVKLFVQRCSMVKLVSFRSFV